MSDASLARPIYVPVAQLSMSRQHDTYAMESNHMYVANCDPYMPSNNRD